MYTTIKAYCVDQALQVASIPKLASGGENSTCIDVTFDEKWSGYGKTAIFYRSRDKVYQVVMQGDTCVIPREVLAEAGRLYFGIIGVSGAVTRTSEVVALVVEQGAITGLAQYTPLPDVYKQVLSAYGDVERRLAKEAAACKSEVAVERARINSIVSGGSSGGDEVVDIRVGSDGITYPSAGEAVRSQVAVANALRTETPVSFIVGTITEGEFSLHANRACFSDKIRANMAVAEIAVRDDYVFGYAVYNDAGVYDGVDHGWNAMAGNRVRFDSGYFRMNFRRSDSGEITAEDLAILASCVSIKQLNIVTEVEESKRQTRFEDAVSSINIEYGREKGASFVFARIPKTTNAGNPLRIAVGLTSEDESLDGAKTSALVYAQKQMTAFTLNAGLFNTSTLRPVGQTIIDGIAMTSTPMTDDMGSPISDVECYPLCIDANGDLSAPYARSVNTADMIADGVVYAVTGWGKVIENFGSCSDTVDNEIVHAGSYIRQVIGQFQNGDYCVCTVDMTRGSVENEAGITYADLAQLLINRGVKFAYSLDGGGSAETVIGARQLNPIYEGVNGRAVPTVITFNVD